MADINPTECTRANGIKRSDALNFTASGQLYALHDDADSMKVKNQLHMRLLQLSTMLTVVIGEGAETFHLHAARVQDEYLWACQSLATECRELSGLL